MRRGVHTVVVAGLTAIILLPALKHFSSVPGTVLLAGAGFVGVSAAVVYWRFPAVRMFLTILLPAVLLFPGLFVFNSPVSKIVLPGKSPIADTIAVSDAPPIVLVVFDEFPTVSLMDEKHEIFH